MSKWLKCNISQGMFSDEFTVVVRTHRGEDFSVFVPREAADAQANRVRVRAEEHNGMAIAVLPDENQSVVQVPSSDLISV